MAHGGCGGLRDPLGCAHDHPTSESVAAKEHEKPFPENVPDPDVELALVSYALPTRTDAGPGSLGKVGCSFTVSVEDGRTSASALDTTDKTPCTMGELTQSVVETLGKWKFATVHAVTPRRTWVKVWVHFEEGRRTAEVDIPQTQLASALPRTPFEGLHVVRQPTPRVRVPPKMPLAAREIDPPFEVACKLRFFLDEQGTPTDIAVEQCPAAFLDSVLEAGWQWRFDPYIVDGVPKSGEFTLNVLFRLK